MKFKSEIVTQASGSIGGTTYSHNRGGLYRRARAIPTNPNTTQQQAVRGFFAQVSAAWRDTLTAAQREAWNTYALNTPISNALGDPINIGGLGMYQRGNIARLQAGLARVDAGPSTFGLPEFTAPGITSLTASTKVAIMTFADADAWLDEDGSAMLIYSSRPVSGAVSFFKGPYQYAGSILGNGTTPLTSPQNVTTNFGLSAGQKVFLKANVTLADGRYSAPIRFPITTI